MTGSNIITYTQLITNFPPRPITNDEQYWATQDRIDALLDKGHLTADEQDYLTALGLMVERYESDHEPDITLRGIRLIRALMEEQGLKQRDMVAPIFKTDSIVSAVLNGKRQLTVEHINKLAAFFDLPHAWFFEPLNESDPAQTKDDLEAANVQPISPRPTKQQPSTFVHFFNSQDLSRLQTQSAKKISLQQFRENERRLRQKVKA